MTTQDRTMIEPTPDECWAMIGTRGLGRLATTNRGRVDIFPLNYLVHDGAIFFRSAPGSKLVDITRSPDVAFEVDGTDDVHHWSVVVHGTAERLGFEHEIYESGVMDLVTWTPTDKFNFVRITPTEISGRRFDRRSFRLAESSGTYGAALSGSSAWPELAPVPSPAP